MELIEAMNQRVKRLTFFDLQLVKLGNIFLALIIVKIIPDIMDVDAGWFVMFFILCTVKPFYAGWIKKGSVV